MKKIHFFCYIMMAVLLFGCYGGKVKKTKPQAQDWLQKGVEYETQGVYEEAIKMYTTAIDMNKKYADAYFNRGKALMARDRTHAMEALKDFNKTIELNPRNADAYYERGLLNALILNNEDARDDMNTAAQLGHTGAQKWLAPKSEETDKDKKEKANLEAAAGASREEAAGPSAPVTEEKNLGPEAKRLNIREYLSSNSEPMVHFDTDMSTIKDEYAAVLDEIALILKERIPETGLVLAGYTDSTGADTHNECLALQRAKAVESYLTAKHGISPDRISIKGYGASSPIAANNTEEGRAQNRRVEFMVAGK
jgi:outer membrane protein OmpA-like peptidoglycan-associated protein